MRLYLRFDRAGPSGDVRLMRTKNVWALVGSIAIALSACSLMMMKVPRGLEAPQAALPVKSEGGAFTKKTINFGPWATVDVDRDWASSESSSWSAGFITTTTTDSTQGYRFNLTERGKPSMRVECLTITNRTSYQRRRGHVTESTQQLGCGIFRASQDSALARLHIAINAIFNSGAGIKGRLEVGTRKLQVHAVFESEQGHRGGPYGYRIADRDTNLAAIQTINGDKLWMAPTVNGDDRDAIAGALAAIALFKSN